YSDSYDHHVSHMRICLPSFTLFSFNHTATTHISTLSLHDALPIFPPQSQSAQFQPQRPRQNAAPQRTRIHLSSMQLREVDSRSLDRKSTRLNSSHRTISYAVFCLKKKKNKHSTSITR